MTAKPRWFKFLLIAFGVSAALFLIEVALRRALSSGSVPHGQEEGRLRESALLFEYDAVLGWKGRAFASGTYRGPGYSFSVRLNSQGLREREVPLGKAKGVLRIMILGDSQTWGLGVESEQRFSEVLERLLREKGRDVEVLNFGMNAYGTDQELLLFTRLGVQYHPDIVIVGFYWNDLFENSLAEAYGYPKPRFIQGQEGGLELRNVPVPRKNPESMGLEASERGTTQGIREPRLWDATKRWLEKNAYSYRLVTSLLRRNRSIYRLAVETGIAGGPRRDSRSVEWRITRSLLEMFKEAVEAAGSEFLVVLLPERADFESDTHFFKRSLIKETSDLPSLDVFPFLAAAGTAHNFYYDNDIHLTADGHRLIARAIFDYLVRNIL